jgi:cytochrome c peroxidase
VTVLLLLVGLEVPLGLDHGLLAPPDNRVTLEKAALGALLFFDRRLSADESLACADCHRPEQAFTDGRSRAVGIQGRTGDRNTPTILNRAFGRSFSWDGVAPTLEDQVIRPIVHPREMAAKLPTVVERLRTDAAMRGRFRGAFGRAPDVEAVAHALATYVRTRLSGRSAYDRFRAGDEAALDARQRLGLRVFRSRAGCSACHSGNNLTDESFHNTGVSWSQPPDDPGRAGVTGRAEDTGRFKTPTLREVARTAPYMHDGSLATLEDVVDFYDRGGGQNPGLDPRIRPLQLTAEEKEAVVAFLASLSGEAVGRN